jgi:hypothetical protein
VAVANLQPVPGKIEYTKGSPECYYSLHVLPSGEVVYCRYIIFLLFHALFFSLRRFLLSFFGRNELLLSEDLRQIITGNDMHSVIAQDDCESDSSTQIAACKGFANMHSVAKEFLLSIGFDNRKGQFATPKDILSSKHLNPDAFGITKEAFAGHPLQQRKVFTTGVIMLCQHMEKPPYVYYITGNAYAPAVGTGASAAGNNNNPQRDVCGHCYCGMDASMVNIPATLARIKSLKQNGQKTPEKVKIITQKQMTILESTKWVNSSKAYGKNGKKASCADPAVVQLQNQCANLLGEITKVSSFDPALDLISNRLEVCLDKQGAQDAFYALSYIHGNKHMFTLSVPGVPTSGLVYGVSMDKLVDGDRSLLFATKEGAYELLTQHVNKANSNAATAAISTGKAAAIIKPGEIKEKLLQGTDAAAIPGWTDREWKKYVFDTYIPSGILYEDPQALKLFHMGECMEGYSPIVFSHECMTDRIRLSSSSCPDGDDPGGHHPHTHEFVHTILSVLHDGEAPPITEVHSKRILTVPCFKGMDMEKQRHKLKTFDAVQVNESIKARHAHF